MVIIGLLAVVFLLSTVLADDIEYVQHLQYLMNVSAKQTFIHEYFPIPNIVFNPGMTLWPLAGPTNMSHINSDMTVMMLSTGGWVCQTCDAKFQVTYINFTSKSAVAGNSSDLLVHTKSNEYIDAFLWAGKSRILDPRIFHAPGNIYKILFSVFTERKIQETFEATIYYNESMNKLIIQAPVYQMSMDHEVGKRHQKNWMPFVADIPSNHWDNSSSLSSQVLYVYSIIPHRIIYVNESMSKTEYDVNIHEEIELMKAHTLCLTENTINPQSFWPYGEIRGGTNAVLVQTVYGPRYLTCFHSSHRWMISYIHTYFMGCYIFESKPPFAITHFMREPLIPKDMYNENNGWAFRAIDYIVFPMNLIVIGDELLMSVGRNDKSGWIVRLEISGLVQVMSPLQHKVIVNEFQ